MEGTEFKRKLPYEVSSSLTAIEKYNYCIELNESEEMNKAAVRVVHANALVSIMCALNNYYTYHT